MAKTTSELPLSYNRAL